MSKKTFTLILILMSIALTGIITMQALWVNNAIKIQEKQFEQNIFSAMKNIISTLETKSVAVRVQFQLHQLDQNMEALISTSDTSVKKITVYTVRSDDSLKVTSTMDIDSVLSKIIIEINTNDNPLERFQLNLLDTIIIDEMKNFGIYLPYEFAVVKFADSIAYKSKGFTNVNLQSNYRSNLFAQDATDKDYYLILDFPDKQTYLYRSVSNLIFFSVFFTLIIVLTFILTIYYMLKQKKLSEIKTDFINNITHELKTPIATLQVAISTLKYDPKFEENETLKLIERQGNRLQTISSRVIDSSFHNKPKLKEENVQIEKFLKVLLSDFEKSMSDQNVKWTHNFTSISGVQLYIDKAYFRAAINNILENAIKYNDKTEKQISVLAKVQKDTFILEIEDNGIGISDKDRRSIFDKFYRGLKGNIHDVKGLGIGLFFTKQIIELHGGKISCESKMQKGSKFIIKIPVNV